MADLATLEQIEERLGLTDPSAEVEAVLDAIRLALQQRVLDLTGFVLVAGQKVETRMNVKLGDVVDLKYRPVETLAIAARSLGGAPTFYAILGDISDAYKGKVIPLSAEITPVFPATGGVAPWYRWRNAIWPVARFTYDVSAIPDDVALVLGRALVEWVAVAWAVHPINGRLKSFSAEKISESYDNYQLNRSAVPPLVALLLGPYIRGTVGIVF